MGTASSGGSFHWAASTPPTCVCRRPRCCDFSVDQFLMRFYLAVDLAILRPQDDVQHEHADVHQQGGEEGFFLLHHVDLSRQAIEAAAAA